jgi:AcrR family transcriptional regulator
MTTAERRQREREAMRSRILEAAHDIALQEGYDALTMRHIAERLEYSAAALYRHFNDKSALLSALLATEFEELTRSLEAVSSTTDPLERIRRAARVYAEFGVADFDRYRQMFVAPPEISDDADDVSMLSPHPAPASPATELYTILRRAVAQAIASLRFRPDVNDVDLVTQTLWAGLHGVVSLHAARTRDSDVPWRPLHQTVNVVIDSLLRGFARSRSVEVGAGADVRGVRA